MNKRIRYGLDADGSYVSKKIIETAHGEVFVKFNLDNRVVQIISATSSALIDTFVATTTHQLKIDIKKKLISMGAVFAEESRKRVEDAV